MPQHSRLAPSASERWINCPASVEMNEHFPDTTSIYAKEGTVAHKLGELKIKRSILNQKVEDSEFKEVYDSEYYNADMEDYTDEYVEYIRSLIESKETTILAETHLNLDFIAPETGGTADCILVNNDTLHVIDLKYGKNVQVEALGNTQLKIYALGACKLFDGLIYDIKKVVVHIVQPRMNNFSKAEYLKKDLNKWLEETVKPQAKKAINNSLEINAGHWCKFCRAKAVCREYGKRFNYDVKVKNPNFLTNAEIADLIRKLDGLKGYLNDLESYALTHALEGESFPGFKPVAGRSTRQWKDQEKAFEIAEANGFDHSVLFETVPLTLSKVEKLMGKKKFHELLSDYVDKPPGKPTLVPESDKRESLVNSNTALEDFKDIQI